MFDHHLGHFSLGSSHTTHNNITIILSMYVYVLSFDLCTETVGNHGLVDPWISQIHFTCLH